MRSWKRRSSDSSSCRNWWRSCKDESEGTGPGDSKGRNTGSGDNGSLFPDKKDVSVKLVQIQESIRYFIESYDTVLNQIAGKKPVVVRINADEVKAAACRIERAEKERAEKEKRNGQNTD